MAHTALRRGEDVLEPIDDILSPGQVFLGLEAPLDAVPTMFKQIIRLIAPGAAANGRFLDRSKHSMEGLLKGLFAQGGVMHARALKQAPGIVTAPIPHVRPSLARAFSTVAGVVDTTLGLVFVATGTLQAAEGVAEAGGARGLVRTRKGRGGALQAVGGALLLIPSPIALLASSALLAVSAGNEFGLLDALGSGRPARRETGDRVSGGTLRSEGRSRRHA